MKASHFNIGKPGGVLVPPKPISPLQPKVDYAPSVNIQEQKERLTQASWSAGSHPVKYESIKRASFSLPGAPDMDKASRDKQLHELKSRIASSSVMAAEKARGERPSYQTQQHATHNPIPELKAPDPKAIGEQKMRLSKTNFIVGESPQSYDTTTGREFYQQHSDYLNKEIRLTHALKHQKTNFSESNGFSRP